MRCVVLTGTGRAFCTGQDLKEHVALLRSRSERRDPLFYTVDEHYNPIVAAIATMAKPVVAAVNGVAAGAGASLAFACDLRILADTAGFNLAFASIALSCDTGASWTLQQLVGRAKALELLYFPRTVERRGVPRARPGHPGRAGRPTSTRRSPSSPRVWPPGPTVALGAIRRAVHLRRRAPLTESLAFEAELMARTGATEDHRDAVAAFLAKQKPVFQGR